MECRIGDYNFGPGKPFSRATTVERVTKYQVAWCREGRSNRACSGLEPNPFAREVADESLDLNLSIKRAVVEPCTCSDDAGEAALHRFAAVRRA
jgi:hypothetical protein